MNSLQYFGTDTRTAGHYFWGFDASGQYMSGSNQSFRDLPFNPENYPANIDKWNSAHKGTVQFDKIGDYTIFAIAGSPIDSRGGCHSVFFIKKDLTEDQIIQKIKITPAAMRIVNQMPFVINHKSF